MTLTFSAENLSASHLLGGHIDYEYAGNGNSHSWRIRLITYEHLDQAEVNIRRVFIYPLRPADRVNFNLPDHISLAVDLSLAYPNSSDSTIKKIKPGSCTENIIDYIRIVRYGYFEVPEGFENVPFIVSTFRYEDNLHLNICEETERLTGDISNCRYFEDLNTCCFNPQDIQNITDNSLDQINFTGIIPPYGNSQAPETGLLTESPDMELDYHGVPDYIALDDDETRSISFPSFDPDGRQVRFRLYSPFRSAYEINSNLLTVQYQPNFSSTSLGPENICYLSPTGSLLIKVKANNYPYGTRRFILGIQMFTTDEDNNIIGTVDRIVLVEVFSGYDFNSLDIRQVFTDSDRFGSIVTRNPHSINFSLLGLDRPITIRDSIQFRDNTNYDVTIKGSSIQFGKNAKLVVRSTKKLTIDNCTLSNCSKFMWKGIFVKNGELQFIRRTLVECAEVGVKLDSIGMGDLQDGTFNRNKIHIAVVGSKNRKLKIRNNLFTSTDKLPAPFRSSWPEYGIIFDRVVNESLNEKIDLNTFEQIYYSGILLKNSSNIVILNNTFQKKLATPEAELTRMNNGIEIVFSQIYRLPNNDIGSYNLSIGDVQATNGPNFKKIGNGIFIHNGITGPSINVKIGGIKVDSLEKKSRYSTKTENGVYYESKFDTTYMNEISIKNSSFRKVKRGIHLVGTAKRVRIDYYNKFDSCTYAGILINNTSTNKGVRASIKVSHNRYFKKCFAGIVSTQVATADVDISNNDSINYCRNGIIVEGNNNMKNDSIKSKTTINGNSINFLTYTRPDRLKDLIGGNYGAGIRVKNLSNAHINSNTIVNTQTPYSYTPDQPNFYGRNTHQTIGIFLDYCMASSLCGNVVKRQNMGIAAIHGCTGSRWMRNEMKNNQFGFFLLENGEIGTQGLLLDNRYWRFRNTFETNLPAFGNSFRLYNTGSFRSNGYLSSIISRGDNSNENPRRPGFSQYEGDSICNNSDEVGDCAFAHRVKNNSLGIPDNYQIIVPYNLVQIRGFEDLLIHPDEHYTVYKTDSRYNTEVNLYKLISMKPTLARRSAILDSFHTFHDNSNIGKLHKASQYLFADTLSTLPGATSSSNTLLSSIIPANQQELNLKTVYQIIIDKRIANSDTFTLAQLNNLKSIASQCETTGGWAVTASRSFLLGAGIFELDNIDYCNSLDPNDSIPNDTIPNQPRTEGFENSTESIKIYPNPATDHVNIQLPDEPVNGVKMEIFDMQGRMILNKEIFQSSDLDTSSFPEGIYLFRFQHDNKPVITQKLIIQR